MSALSKDEAKRRLQPVPLPEEQPQEEEQPRRRYFSLKEALGIPPPEWLWEDKLQRDSVAMIVGAYATYKTFYAINIALTIATSERVFYLAGESISQFPERLKAWLEAHPETDIDVLDHNFTLVDDVVQLASASTDLPQFIMEIEERLNDDKPALIIVDTYSRANVGNDENTQRDTTLAVAGCDYIRRKYKCCVLLIHHVGKDGKLRGSTVLPGGLDTIILIEKETTGIKVSCEKQKNGKAFTPEYYTPATVLNSLVLDKVENGKVEITTDNISKDIMRILIDLANSFPRGKTKGELIGALEIPKAKDRTFGNWLGKAVDGGYLRFDGQGKPYFLTAKGQSVLPKDFRPQPFELQIEDER